MLKKNIVIADNWDYIWNEETWNAARGKKNSALNEFLSKHSYDYRYNTYGHRLTFCSDKLNGEWPDYCQQSWEGATKFPNTKFPWCVVNIEPFYGTIKLNYNGGEDIYPWGEVPRNFRHHYAIISIPTELGEEFLLDENGNTTFEPEKLTVVLIYG